jgi:hypothetical protein
MDDEELFDAIAALYEKAQVDGNGDDEIELGEVSEEQSIRINLKIGVDLKGFKIHISLRTLKHIYQQHGQEFDRFKDQRPVDVEDVINIPSILREFEDVVEKNWSL